MYNMYKSKIYDNRSIETWRREMEMHYCKYLLGEIA